jgi:hypothetical protein
MKWTSLLYGWGNTGPILVLALVPLAALVNGYL